MTMPHQNPHIRALGEIALRVNDVDAMQAFYENIIGLELVKRFENVAFLKIAPGHAGHTQVLALFDRSAESAAGMHVRQSPQGVAQERSTLDHLAFSIDLADFDKEVERLKSLGCEVYTTTHE